MSTNRFYIIEKYATPQIEFCVYRTDANPEEMHDPEESTFYLVEADTWPEPYLEWQLLTVRAFGTYEHIMDVLAKLTQ